MSSEETGAYPVSAGTRSRGAALVRSDAIALPLRDESVDLVVTSPPYFALRSYTDDGEHYGGQIGSEPTPADFLAALWAVTEECKRVLKPTGSIFVNLGDKYAGTGGANDQTGLMGTPQYRSAGVDRRRGSRNNTKQTSGFVPRKSLMGLPWRYAIGCTDHLDLILRAEIIWSKPNGMPESVTDRVRRSHEQWFHFTKEPRYFSCVDDVREPYTPGTAERYVVGYRATDTEAAQLTKGYSSADGGPTSLNPLGKLPSSVWTIATEPLNVPEHVGTDHFAAFPQEWPRRLILGWSPADGVVLDPFGGTGTTAMVARALGRFGISNDLSTDYLRLARWRVFESGHAAKSHDRTMREAQLSMLGATA